jgi:hypothetical protein
VTLHVFAVGDPDDPLLTHAFGAAAETPELRKVRASESGELVSKLQSVVASERRLIDVLDLFDHGNPGVQYFGRRVSGERPVLFRSDHLYSTPLQGLPPDALKDVLSTHAVVRLLGCETGGTSNPSLAVSAGRAGRALILKVAHRLGGQRTVMATVVPVVGPMFGSHGLLDGPARESLLSSHACWDNDPPTNRIENIDKLIADGFPPP